MHAAPTQKARPVGLKQPPSTDVDRTTPRGEEAKKAARMSAAEKAITPCMFFAYNACRAKSCAFLHSETNRYQGPPPRALVKGGKAPSNAYASVATVIVPEIAAPGAIKPVITAMPFEASTAIPWLWDTAAGRHLIGRRWQPTRQRIPNL